MNDNIFVKKINHAWITQFLQVTQNEITYSENKSKRNVLPLCRGYWEY